MSIVGLLLATLIGISLGLLGGGGSILAVPVLTYVVKLPVKEAIATSLIVVGSASLLGLFWHWRAKNVDLRAALVFGVTSMAGAFAGGRLATYFADWLQLTIFALVMLAAAISMLRRKETEQARAHPSVPVLMAAAAGVGLLTGIVGIGGGFLIVPALVMFGRVPMKPAVGTSLLVIAMNSAAGFAGYAGRVAVPWKVALLFVLFAGIGVAAGSALSHRMSTQRLRKSFAIFLMFVALFVLYRNRESLAHAISGYRSASRAS